MITDPVIILEGSFISLLILQVNFIPDKKNNLPFCRIIPEQGNRAEVVLKVLHRSFMGGDEFLGQISLPLQDFDIYEKPKAT